MTGLFQHIAFISMPGGSEWVVILIIGLLVFGRRLPEVARNLGKSVNEFKKGMREFQESADEVARDVSKVTNDAMSDESETSSVNDYGYYEPDAATSDAGQCDAPESAGTSDADHSGATESTDTTTEVATGDPPEEAGATESRQSEQDPHVEPMK